MSLFLTTLSSLQVKWTGFRVHFDYLFFCPLSDFRALFQRHSEILCDSEWVLRVIDIEVAQLKSWFFLFWFVLDTVLLVEVVELVSFIRIVIVYFTKISIHSKDY